MSAVILRTTGYITTLGSDRYVGLEKTSEDSELVYLTQNDLTRLKTKDMVLLEKDESRQHALLPSNISFPGLA